MEEVKKYKLEETKISDGGLYRCCIDTIINLNPETEFENGTIIDCKYETPRNESIILVDGVWRYNDKQGMST